MTDLEHYAPPAHPWVAAMEPAWNLAQRLERASEFIPAELRGRGEAIMAMILTGLELDMGPLWALRNLHVVNGRVAMSAEGMRALVFRGGHSIWPVEATDQRVVMAGRRRGETSDPVTVEWTAHRAQTAGLTGNPSWRKYPRAMLTARATSELCRLLFPDVIAGMSGDDDIDTAVNGSAAVNGPAPVRRRRAPHPDAAPAGADQTAEGGPVARPLPPERDESGSPITPAPSAPPSAPDYDLLLQSLARIEDDAQAAALIQAAFAEPAERDDEAELKVRRKLFAQLLEALPEISRGERERYRHALTALVTRNRDSGPIIHFGQTTDLERTELAARIADLRTAKLLAHTDPDGSIVFSSRDRAAIVCPADDDARWSVLIEDR